MASSILKERLRLLIEETGLQQQEIAAILGIKMPTFNGYVIGKREPTIEKLNQFADYFNVSVDFLIGHTDIRDPYLKHLPDDLNSFVRDPANKRYIELARDIKEKTHDTGDKSLSI